MNQGSDTLSDEDEIDEELPALTPEEQAAFDATMVELEAACEEQLTRLYGPPAVRDRRNKRYVRDLVAKHTEPVIRGILIALWYGGAESTSENLNEDDLTLPLDQIINCHYGCGLCLRVKWVVGTHYVVSTSGGVPECCAGGGGEYLVKRDGDSYTVTDSGRQWIS